MQLECFWEFEQAERGGRESNIPKWWQPFQIHDCKGRGRKGRALMSEMWSLLEWDTLKKLQNEPRISFAANE